MAVEGRGRGKPVCQTHSPDNWRKVIDPPDRGEVVWVKDENVPGWEEPASLVTSGHNIWVSELSGHIVYPTHWRAME